MRASWVIIFSLLLVQAFGQPSDALGPIEPTGAIGYGGSGSLARVMDAFISAYASETPIWRTAVTTNNATAESACPAGMQKGRTESGLWYFFRPKTSDMLTLDERRGVMRDKRFGPFLAQMRALADGKIAPLPEGLRAAGKSTPSPTPPTVPALGRSDLLARLMAGRRPPPDTIYFDISAEELVLPGRIIIGADITSTSP